MLRKPVTVAAVLALSITLRVVPTTAQQNDAQPNDASHRDSSSDANKQGNQPEQNQRATDNARGVPPPLIRQVRTTIEAQAPEQQTNEWPDAWFFRWLAWWLNRSTPAEWATVIVAAGGVFAAMRTLGVLRDEAAATAATAEATKLAQRAYVGFGPSLVPIRSEGSSRTFRAMLHLHNFGNTPATIETVLLARRYDTSITDDPRYDEHRMNIGDIRVFLVKDGDFYTDPVEFTIEDFGGKTLWLFGYVIYSDRFHCRHKAGFARRYLIGANSGGENLVWETRPQYNYDKQES